MEPGKLEAASVNPERERFERAVIEAVKSARLAEQAYSDRMILENWKQQVETRGARDAAVDALIDFESAQQLKNQTLHDHAD